MNVAMEPAPFGCENFSCYLGTSAAQNLPRVSIVDTDGRAMSEHGFPNRARDHDGQRQKQTPPEASFATAHYGDARLQRDGRGGGREIMVTHGHLRELHGKT